MCPITQRWLKGEGGGSCSGVLTRSESVCKGRITMLRPSLSAWMGRGVVGNSGPDEGTMDRQAKKSKARSKPRQESDEYVMRLIGVRRRVKSDLPVETLWADCLERCSHHVFHLCSQVSCRWLRRSFVWSFSARTARRSPPSIRERGDRLGQMFVLRSASHLGQRS
jgi:hypothetical protein